MTGKRGPKSKSARELLASGSKLTPGGDDGPELEQPQTGRGSNKPPEWMTEGECLIWDDFLPKAREMKTYGKADHFSFGQFCKAANDLLDAQAELKKVGLTYNTYYTSGSGDDAEARKSPKKSPLIDVVRVCRDTYNKYADQFGFNPLARTRLKIVPYQAKAPTTPAPVGVIPGAPPADDGPGMSDEDLQKMMRIEPTT